MSTCNLLASNKQQKKKATAIILLTAAILQVTYSSSTPLHLDIYNVVVVLPNSNQKSCQSLFPWIRGEDIQPAMELATYHINSHHGILQNHSLQLCFIQDGCNEVAETIHNFVEKVFASNQSRHTGLIGPSNYLSANTIQSTIHERPTALVMLEVTQKIESFLSSQSLVSSLVNLVKVAQWTNVSLLIDGRNEFYTNLGSEFMKKNQHSNVHVNVFSKLPVYTLRDLASNNSFNKAIIVLAVASVFKQIVCLPVSQKLEHHQWVHVGPSGQILTEAMQFTQNGNVLNCTKKFYVSALEMSLLISPSYFFSESRLEPMNITLQEYLHTNSEYRKKYNTVSPYDLSSTYSEFSNFFYDCVWAWGSRRTTIQ